MKAVDALLVIFLMIVMLFVGMCAGKNIARENFCERDGGEMIDYEVCVDKDSVLWRVD